MTVFVLASLAIVLVLVALALRPLWTGARRSALALALALGVGTAGLYALLGTPDALDPAQVKAPETLEEAIVQLERRLADEPGSVEGWVLLGRSHAAQGNWTAAADAFGKAQALLPEEPDLMVELAEAMVAKFQENMATDKVEGTPTLFIDGVPHGNMSYEDLKVILDAELAK